MGAGNWVELRPRGQQASGQELLGWGQDVPCSTGPASTWRCSAPPRGCRFGGSLLTQWFCTHVRWGLQLLCPHPALTLLASINGSRWKEAQSCWS